MPNRDSSFRSILRLALPALAQGLLSTIVFITDRLILAAYSEQALGSMQVSGPLGWILGSLFAAFGVGMSSWVGRSYGAKTHDEIGRYLTGGLILSLFMGILLSILGLSFVASIASLMVDPNQVSNGLMEDANIYLRYLFSTIAFQVLSANLNGALQAIGNTKWPMYSTLVAGLINLGLSATFVHGLFGCPKLGVEGAAIGTAVCYVVQFLLNLAPVFHKKTVLKFRRTTKEHLRRIVSVSLPTIGERTLYHGAYLVFCAMIGHLGDQAMSVHQALISIESFGFISASAFGIAAFTLSAQKIGAQEPEEAQKAVKRTILLGGITLSLFGALLVVFGDLIIGQFVSSPESIALGYSCMLVAAFAQPLMAYVEIWSAAFRGAGNTKTPMIAAFIGPTIIRLSSCYLLAFHYEMGLVGIWVGSTIDWVFRTLFFFLTKNSLAKSAQNI